MNALKVKNSKFWNNTLNIPFDGEIKVDSEGNIKVSDKAAEVLLQSPEDFADPNTIEEEKEEIVENEKTSTPLQELTVEEINAIEQLTVKQLAKLAAQYEVKGFEKIQGKKKQIVVAFLKNAFNKRLKK